MTRVSSLLRHSRLTGARGHNRTRPAFYALNKYRKRAGVTNSNIGGDVSESRRP
jgi:hypothetical protein